MLEPTPDQAFAARDNRDRLYLERDSKARALATFARRRCLFVGQGKR